MLLARMEDINEKLTNEATIGEWLIYWRLEIVNVNVVETWLYLGQLDLIRVRRLEFPIEGDTFDSTSFIALEGLGENALRLLRVKKVSSLQNRIA